MKFNLFLPRFFDSINWRRSGEVAADQILRYTDNAIFEWQFRMLRCSIRKMRRPATYVSSSTIFLN